ncbi:hypothetical protein ASD11_14995 [Aeromicrobium sp. Root495]|nr:hypothetical protein ASD11_14995 [Aeromicrobium sp. Root495]
MALDEHSGTRPNPGALESARRHTEAWRPVVDLDAVPYIDRIRAALGPSHEAGVEAFLINGRVGSDERLSVLEWLVAGRDLAPVLRLADESRHGWE